MALYAPAADVHIGSAASATFLKHADLLPYGVLHFRTHAVVDEQSVAGTALVLAPGEGESGFVSAGDLTRLHPDADLVVLSACRAARGVEVGGEGVQGLTSPLLQAGARSLVATAWRIRDRDAAPFMTAFYDALARGLPVIDGLWDARLYALRRHLPARRWGRVRGHWRPARGGAAARSAVVAPVVESHQQRRALNAPRNCMSAVPDGCDDPVSGTGVNRPAAWSLDRLVLPGQASRNQRHDNMWLGFHLEQTRACRPRHRSRWLSPFPDAGRRR